MICPLCPANLSPPMHVVDGRRLTATGAYRRRRACRICNYRETHYEIGREDYRLLVRIKREIERMKESE